MIWTMKVLALVMLEFIALIFLRAAWLFSHAGKTDLMFVRLKLLS